MGARSLGRRCRLALGVACLGAVAVWAASAASATQRIVFGHVLAESTVHHRALVAAAAALEKACDGRYLLEIYPGGQLGASSLETMEGFRTGLTDMTYISLAQSAKIYGPIAVGAAPFVFRDFEHWLAFRDSSLFKDLIKGLEERADVKVLGTTYYGERHISSRKPIASLADLNGLVIRVPNFPSILMTFRWLGAAPVPIPFNEVYQALQDGVIEAQENPLPTIKAMNFHTATPIITLTGHIADSLLIVMAQPRWAALPAADQAAFAQIFQTLTTQVTSEVRASEIALVEELRADGVRIESIDRAALAQKVQRYVDSDKVPWGPGLYRRVQDLR